MDFSRHKHCTGSKSVKEWKEALQHWDMRVLMIEFIGHKLERQGCEEIGADLQKCHNYCHSDKETICARNGLDS